MRAEPFVGDADGPDLAIDTADDGTPLPDCRGWTCGGGDTLFAEKGDAEGCCVGPCATAAPPIETPDRSAA